MDRIVLAVSGTPCTGKTTLARKLSKRLGFELVDLTEFVRSRRLSDGFDLGRDTLVVDERKLAAEFRKWAKGRGNLIVDGLLSHLLPATHVIVLRANPLLLERRMRMRGYLAGKVRENLEAEYLGVILHEALDRSRNVLELDSTRAVNVKEIENWLRTGGVRVSETDWTADFVKTLKKPFKER